MRYIPKLIVSLNYMLLYNVYMYNPHFSFLFELQTKELKMAIDVISTLTLYPPVPHIFRLSFFINTLSTTF